jgi:dienelactone hydrolase
MAAALLCLASFAPVHAQSRCPGDCDGDGAVDLAELVEGVGLVLGSSGAAAETCPGLERADIASLVAAVDAALRGCPPVPVALDAALESGGGALLLTPHLALHGSSRYALILTSRIRDQQGESLQPSEYFRALAGIPAPIGSGPVALYSADPDAADNPYPDSRLVRADGTVRIPDRFALRDLPAGAELDAARALLRDTAVEVGMARGFSTTAPIRIALSAPVDPTSVTTRSALLFAVPDAAVDLHSLLAAAARRSIPGAEVALALSFPTQPIENDLRAIRQQLLEHAAQHAFVPILVDPDPQDDLPIGVFGPDDPTYADYLAGNPDVALVVRGLMRSFDFRGDDGFFDAARIDGEAAPLPTSIDFFLTVPTGPGPHPVVIVQHGFGGDDSYVLTIGPALAQRGIAAIGISALAHGRRGSPLELLQSTPLETRDLFRQTIVDQMALVRTVESGIDLDGDGTADLQSSNIGYLGVSLGGILGGTFMAVEDAVRTGVLNVAGGRVAFLGDNPGTRPIYTSYFAQQVGLPVDSAEFEVFLQRLLELGQQGLDPADPLNYARHWALMPFAGVSPHRILMQEGIGDLLVNNGATEALAREGDLLADTPMHDDTGVSGLWRFDPPGGHEILMREDVLTQAVEYLASDGTVIATPATAGSQQRR